MFRAFGLRLLSFPLERDERGQDFVGRVGHAALDSVEAVQIGKLEKVVANFFHYFVEIRIRQLGHVRIVWFDGQLGKPATIRKIDNDVWFVLVPFFAVFISVWQGRELFKGAQDNPVGDDFWRDVKRQITT